MKCEMWMRAVACSVSFVLATTIGGRAAEYLLQPGDVLSLMIVGSPEFSRNVSIEIDGTAWFPIVGPIAAKGNSLDDVRRRVAQAYVGTISSESASGSPKLIQASQVYVSVEEYRPVYVSGELFEPRAIPFRPGLTLQQALALAGGQNANGSVQVGLAERVEAAEAALSRVYARIWSLKRLLGIDAPEDYQNILVNDSAAVRQIAEMERSMMEAQLNEQRQKKAQIEASIEHATGRLSVLLQQKASEEEGKQLDDQAVAEVRDLFNRGSPLAPASRLAEVRRTALASASRVLEIDVAAESVRTELSELRAQAAALDSGDQSATWSVLSDALTDVKEKRAQLAVLRSASTGILGVDIVASIIREGKRLPNAPDGTASELFPGDIVEVERAQREPAHDLAPVNQ